MALPTIREALLRKKRWGTVPFGVAWLLALLIISQAANKSLPLVIILPVVVVIAAVIYLSFFIRCPRCRGNIGILNVSVSKTVRLLPPISFCPYCGVSLDEPLVP